MLDNKGFDLWADGYDESVCLSEEKNDYPFAGHKDVLGNIYNKIRLRESAKVLDIGFGTAVLISRLYDNGYNIFGIDFSEKMIKIAKEKMPNAKLIKYDFSNGLPDEIVNEKIDFIVCTYAMHHLTNNDKVVFINKLLSVLNDEGEIIIGDVMFETRLLHNECKIKEAKNWDDDEIYCI